jgi:hypothetical protein
MKGIEALGLIAEFYEITTAQAMRKVVIPKDVFNKRNEWMNQRVAEGVMEFVNKRLEEIHKEQEMLFGILGRLELQESGKDSISKEKEEHNVYPQEFQDKEGT